MNIRFDENGFIKPYIAVEIDLETFQTLFAFNPHRKRLFDEYAEFIGILKNMHTGSFYQYVNGSYTTQKTFPKDIDFVSFVDSNFYRKFERRLHDIAKDFKQYGLDAYFEPIFPETHFMSAVTRYNTEDWKQLYGRDRQFRRKGFIHLNF